MNRIIINILILTLLLFISIGGAASQTMSPPTAAEIVERADEQMTYQSAFIESRLLNTDRFGTKTISYRAWAQGSDFLMEFTSTAERGQKILRTADRIYHFFPDSETVFTRSRGDEIMGLISYEDLTDESGMLENYEVSMDGEETLGVTPCYRIAMKAKPRRRVAYPLQTIWIEKESFIVRRIEMFTRTGQPLKTMEMRKVEERGGKLMATDILITDEVRPGVRSEIFIEKVELEADIPEGMFSLDELTW